jgi:ATP adenylyltransferase
MLGTDFGHHIAKSTWPMRLETLMPTLAHFVLRKAYRMNKYPYNSGHLLVCTNRHVALYDQLTPEEVTEVGELTAQAMRTLRIVAKADGFNIGLNQGNVAGAGVADHIHQHIVPRWAGDINFMPIVGGTKVLPELIEQTRLLLSESWSD